MGFTVKLLAAVAVIVICTQLAKARPELAGLIAVMPLTGLIVLLWVYSDCGGGKAAMSRYTLGAVWGIVPTIMFFLTAYLCFRGRLGLGAALGISAGVWLAAAMVHQYLLGR
jgi:uncharacterized membrane protein (GlpM family)